MTKTHATVNDWKSLYKTTYNGILVGDLCRSLPQHIAIFKQVSVCVCDGEPPIKDSHIQGRATSLEGDEMAGPKHVLYLEV